MKKRTMAELIEDIDELPPDTRGAVTFDLEVGLFYRRMIKKMLKRKINDLTVSWYETRHFSYSRFYINIVGAAADHKLFFRPLIALNPEPLEKEEEKST